MEKLRATLIRSPRICVPVLATALACCGGGSEAQPAASASQPVTITTTSTEADSSPAEIETPKPTAAETETASSGTNAAGKSEAGTGTADSGSTASNPSSTTSIPAFVMPSIAAPAIPAGQAFEASSVVYSTDQTLRLDGLKIEEGKILLRADGVANLTITDIEARNHGPIARARGQSYFTAERIRVANGRADATYGLGIVNVTSGGFTTGTFRDLVYAGDPSSPAPNAADAWAVIALKGKSAHDTGSFLIERFDFRDLWMAPGSNYQNVDGISTEGGYTGTIRDGRIVGASDACLDLKGDVSVDNVYLDNCREGIKLWSSQSHGLVNMGTHRFAAIIAKSTPEKPVSVYIETLILSGDPSVPALRSESGPVNLTIGTLVASPDQVLQASNSYAGTSVEILKRIDL